MGGLEETVRSDYLRHDFVPSLGGKGWLASGAQAVQPSMGQPEQSAGMPVCEILSP